MNTTAQPDTIDRPTPTRHAYLRHALASTRVMCFTRAREYQTCRVDVN
jgi:hypothetical protein